MTWRRRLTIVASSGNCGANEVAPEPVGAGEESGRLVGRRKTSGVFESDACVRPVAFGGKTRITVWGCGRSGRGSSSTRWMSGHRTDASTAAEVGCRAMIPVSVRIRESFFRAGRRKDSGSLRESSRLASSIGARSDSFF